MLQADQSEAVECLKRASPDKGSADLIFTHASIIVLAGDRAFKLKRAVRYPYLDYSTPERRLDACRLELELNRRTAPSLYLRVRTITRDEDGTATLDGKGELLDAAVEMRRFSQEALFDSMAQKGELTASLMTELARTIARFHRDASVNSALGGERGIARVLDINDRSLREAALVPPDVAEGFAQSFRHALKGHAERLEARRRAGKVRRCHGDLILRNICLLGGEPTLFDCLEFDEDLATIDVLYDLAFLLMDLWHRGQHDLANLVFNRYLDEWDETDGLAALPFFMAVRAAVRAHVTAAQALKAPPEGAETIRAEAQAYFDLAQSLLAGGEPVLVAVGGLSGTGKSTIAGQVASGLGAPPGARVLNSDRIRKRMHGVRAEEPLGDDAYRSEVSLMVYEALRQQAAAALSEGCAVVLDAVFDRPSERHAVEDVAAAAGVRFWGIWLEAPLADLLPRLKARRNDPSDATAKVLLAQARRECGPITWMRLDATGRADETREKLLTLLRGP